MSKVTDAMYEAGLNYLKGRGTAWCVSDLYKAMSAAKTAGEIGTMINHERELHCCGCWIIRYDAAGLNAVCNECGETRDLIALLARPEARSAWIPVGERLPEGKRGVSYMTLITDVVLVLHKDRPDYPITAHALLGDDLDCLGVRIPTNFASPYKWIAWHSAGRDLCNPFVLATGHQGPMKDSVGYDKYMPNYFGFGITHWMPCGDKGE